MIFRVRSTMLSALARLEDKLCQKESCPHVGENGRHKLRLGGNEMKVGTWLKWRMPEKLVLYLLSSETSFGIQPSGVMVEFERQRRVPQQVRQQQPWGPVVAEKGVAEKGCNVEVQFCGHKRQQGVRAYKIESRNKEFLQLVLKVEVQLENGTTKFLNALVDTGAQTNLLKSGVASFRCTHKGKEPLEVIAANGEIIRGGDRETSVKLRFEKVAHDGKVEKQKPLRANFHLADTGVDAILSYPWLKETKVGIFPHLKSLAIPHSEQMLLRSQMTSKDHEKSSVQTVEESHEIEVQSRYH